MLLMTFPVFLKMIFILIGILLSVAFLTLYERKILSYLQIRKGPNKSGTKGLLQPFSDALKLEYKEEINPWMSNYTVFLLSPLSSLVMGLIMWMIYPSQWGSVEMSISVVFIFCLLSFSVYPVMMAGWSSNSKYTLLGSMRAVAQTISYEVSFALTILVFMMLITSLSMSSLLNTLGEWFVWLSIPLTLIWLISSLAETSRTPFDFVEGESELVSGFNTEYSAGGFVMYFLAEYMSILFMSLIFSLMFLGAGSSSLNLMIKTVTMTFIFVWIRGTLPRLRYDKLMSLAWKSFLPVVLSYLIFSLSMIPI